MRRMFKALMLAGGLVLSAAGVSQAQTIDRLVLAAGTDASTLAAPDVNSFMPDRALSEHIADPLFRTFEPGKLTPWLATGYKEVDDLVLEVYLRKGVKFSNGEPFNAETVKYYVETIQDPKKGNMQRPATLWIARVEIVDEHTVRLIAKSPNPVRLKQIASWQMMPPKYIAEVGWDEFRKKPIGTGPFTLGEHVRDSHILLKARNDWWGGPVEIKELYYRPIKEEAARAAAVMAGEVDIAFDLSAEMIPMIERSGRAKIKSVLSTRTYMLQMNTLNPAFPGNNPKFREAVNYALDRDALNQSILSGTGEPAAFWSPWTFGLNPDNKPVRQDVERAKKALADAGFPNGLDVVLDSPYGRYVKDKELAEAIAGQLTAVGIRTTVQTYEWGVLNQRLTSRKMGPLYLQAWSDPQADPEVPNTRVLKTGGIQGLISYPELDGMIDKISSEMDAEKRKQLIYEEQEYLKDNNITAFLLHMGFTTAVSEKASWWSPVSTERYFFLKQPKL